MHRVLAPGAQGHVPEGGARMKTSTTVRLWRSGARGNPVQIRGVEATIRAGYEPRLLHQCCCCGDFCDADTGWHAGSCLPFHRVSHGLCRDCKAAYYGEGTNA